MHEIVFLGKLMHEIAVLNRKLETVLGKRISMYQINDLVLSKNKKCRPSQKSDRFLLQPGK